MNDRIKDLFEQACFETEYDDVQNLKEMSQRFAELIVKECVTVLNNRFMGDMNREDMEVRRCVADLKEHFGVKE